MKILQLTTHFNIGGITTYILTLSKELKAMGAEVVVASSGGSVVEELSRSGIKHLNLDIKTKSEISPKVFRSYRFLADYIRREGFDVIHSHTRVSQVLGKLLSKTIPIPFVATCHGFYKRRLGRRIFPCWGDATIAISEAVKKALICIHKIPDANITVVYNGIDLNRFSKRFDKGEMDGFKSELGLGGGHIIGVISRLVRYKGIDYLIRAFKKILERYPDSNILIVGDGPDKNRLKDIAESLGISKDVKIMKASFDTPRLLSAIDIFVLPSIADEGLGLAILEAMAASKPVIGTRSGGIIEIIESGKDGILIEPMREDLITDTILELIDKPELRRGMGINARRSAEKRFSSGVMAENIFSIYSSVSAKMNNNQAPMTK